MKKNKMTISPHTTCSISTYKKYASIIRLLDEVGPWNERLDQVYRIVKNPDFVYLKSPFALFLSATLINSSYWLDKELFDTSMIKKSLSDRTLNGVQKSHLYLLDIGSVLINKGFPLNKKTINISCPKESPMRSWAKNFLIQCHKRNTWIKKTRSVLRKNLSYFQHKQKTP